MLEIVILAAGASTRLGRSKQLLTINGESLVHRAASTACELTDFFHLQQAAVVVGKDHQDVENALANLPITTVYNPDWMDGMGTSVATAVRNLNVDSKAVLLMTCDQVLINSDILKSFIQQWQSRPEQIIASAYSGIIGVPAIFPERYFPELLKLQSDKGARGLLQKYREDVMVFDMPSASQDLDSVEDEDTVRRMFTPS